jgi:hypothetical protein
MNNTDKKFIKQFVLRNWLIAGALLLIGLLFTKDIALGIFAGGLISITSFYWLIHCLNNILNPNSGAMKIWMHIFHLLKIVIIALVLLLLIINFKLNPIGLLVGLSVIVINVMYIASKSLLIGDLT